MTFLVSIKGTSEAKNTLTLELDARAESLVDMTHEQSLKVFIRQLVLFGTKNIFALPTLAQRPTPLCEAFECCQGKPIRGGVGLARHDMFHPFFQRKIKLHLYYIGLFYI